MAKSKRAPNRPMELADLELPNFKRVQSVLEALLRRTEGYYLHPSKRWEYPWALERAPLPVGSRVLDIGCGASIFPLYLAESGHRVVACDREVPTRHATTPNLSYLRGDLTAIPIVSATFDAVFCISVIEHLEGERIAIALSELRRVLRPGGLLLLTTDFYRQAGVELWYEGPGTPFRVDWQVFDEQCLRQKILSYPGFTTVGDIDLSIDWPSVQPRMRRFHGYPYTSVGVALRATG
jgi:SAM-dependent methyltransferase